LELIELEVIRLIDLEGLTQEQAGQKMGISRGTIWRILHRARRKIAQALVEGRRIKITDI
jgi:RNA polymerase sigma factor (sigma-70 family)